MIGKILFFAVFICCSGSAEQKSVTGSSSLYRKTCLASAQDEEVFQTFRSLEPYFHAVECGQAGEFAEYVLKHATARTLSLLSEFRVLDLYGNPTTHDMPGVGRFSGTALRYVLFADQISQLFSLPEGYTAAEIGAGFGGQAYILSKLLPYSQYYIFDLPEVELLIQKMMSKLSVENVVCLNSYGSLLEESIDLFISNYAFSECDRTTQIDYIDRVVAKAKRGYMLYNDINLFDHLTVSDFIEELQKRGIQPKVRPEPVFSYTGNVLITWDQTK